MNTLYHYLGFGFFWGAVLVAAYVCALGVWDSEWFGRMRRRWAHLGFVWRVFILGRKPYVVRKENLFFLREIASKKRKHPFDRWERDIAAYLIRYARKVNFIQPN